MTHFEPASWDRALAAIGREVARTDDPGAALELIASRAASAFGVEECLVCEYDEALDALVCRAGTDDVTSAARRVE